MTYRVFEGPLGFKLHLVGSRKSFNHEAVRSEITCSGKEATRLDESMATHELIVSFFAFSFFLAVQL